MGQGKFGLCSLVVAGLIIFNGIRAEGSSIVLEGRDIHGHAVAYNDVTAVFEYDPIRNLTWLRDWNVNGLANWSDQMDWASNLTVGKFSDWLLPQIQQYSDLWSDVGCTVGVLCTELKANGLTDYQIANGYWSGTENPGDPRNAYYIDASHGQVVSFSKAFDGLNATAVRNGDVARVPEPSTLSTMLTALGALVLIVRLSRYSQ